MSDLNKVLLIGRATTAPAPMPGEWAKLPPSTTSRGKTTDHTVLLPPDLAAKATALTKGRLVYVEGTLDGAGSIVATCVHYLGQPAAAKENT